MSIRQRDSEWARLRRAAAAAEARYDHETAVASYAAALEHPELTLEERYALLNGQANAYYQWGNIKPYAHAVAELITLARQIGDKRLLGQAMAVHGFQLAYDGDDRPPETFAREAIKLASELQDDALLCYAQLLLAQIRYDKEAVTETWALLHQSLEVARRSNDDDALFTTLVFLSGASAVFNQLENAQSFAREALALAEKSGDLFKIAQATAYAGIASTDLAVKRSVLEAALAQARAANNLRSIARCANYMALLAWRLGLYDRALAYGAEATHLARRLELPEQLSAYLETVGRSYLAKGMLPEARRVFQEGLEQAPERWSVVVFHYLGQGLTALAEGRIQEAIAQLQQAREAFDPLRSTVEAALGTAYLELDDAEHAFEHTSLAVSLLDTSQGLQEFQTQEIWWRHYRVLQQWDPPAAFAALDKAKQEMLEAITNLSDEGLRRNYLNKVPVNRSITLAWVEEAARRELPLDAFTAHQPIAGNLREQFRRVVDIGTRLTAQHDPDSLADFIVQEFVEMSGAERVILLSIDNGRSSVLASFNAGDAHDLAGQLLGRVGQSRRPLLRHHVGELTEGVIPEIHQRSSIALPLVAQNRLLGLLYGDMRQIFGRFDENDLNLLSMLANQAAAALDNAELVTTLETKVSERTADLRAAKLEAEAANESKSRFLASMSHELRTPLNAIIGFTRIVQRKTKDVIPVKQSDNLDKVKASAEHLLGLINSILDIAKIEAGRMEVVNEPFAVGLLVEMCAAVTRPLLHPGVQLKIVIEPDLPPFVSDQDKLKQILLNLLSNAAKFTHEGEIIVSGERRMANGESQLAAPNSDSQLIIFVRDTGIGMNDEQLARVFEEFQQAEPTTAKTYGGTGLGLPISKQLAQLLGGDLTAQSRPGQGSTFTLTIPEAGPKVGQ